MPNLLHEIEFRELRADDDLAALTTLIHSAYAPHASSGLRYWGTHQTVEDTAIRYAEGHGLIGILDGEYVCTITVRPAKPDSEIQSYRDREVWTIAQFAVAPRFKGQGIGKRLHELATQFVMLQGGRAIAFDTAQPATGLIAMYRSWGYEEVGECDWRPHTNYLSVVMQQRLDLRKVVEAINAGGETFITRSMQEAAAIFPAMSEAEPATPEQEAGSLQAAIDSAPAALAALDEAKSDSIFLVVAPRAAWGAFMLGRYELAEELAHKMLSLSTKFTDTWNYGDDTFSGHHGLGLLALRRGDVAGAIRELHMAGQTCGSPVLGSFGPSMQLAKALLKLGETDAVLDYLRQCRVFWKSGGLYLDIWEEKIRAGVVPNFFARSYRW